MSDPDRNRNAAAAQKPSAAPPRAAPPAPSQGAQGQWLIPVALACLLVVGLSVFRAAAPPPERIPVSLAAFGGTSAGAAAVSPQPEPTIALAVYDAAQAARFVRGLARFDTPALIAYAALTERDMALRNQPLRAELGDALALIRAELARRSNRTGG